MILPKPTGEFEWTQESWGAALRCTAMAATPHLFSTRQLALSGAYEEEVGNWLSLAHVLNKDANADAIVRLRQVHCADVFEASRATVRATPFTEWPEADIATTDDPALVMTVRAADCVPVLLADRQSGAVSAIHAGWRGTAAGAMLAAVQAMTRRFGSEPRNIVAAVGPSIGPCCYSVGEELIQQFASHPGSSRWFDRASGLHLNLWKATRDQLERAGLVPSNIHVSELCTFDHPDVFHSYRRDGKNAGRLVAAIRARPNARSAPDTTL
jgi:YfiH family protein